MRLYKMIIAYDGTHYRGWQRQSDALAIQEVIEHALAIILKEKPKVVGAGRTDSGVHALGQTAHFESTLAVDTFKLLASLNGLLPKDIRIKSLHEAAANFHARYSAINKEYHYHLHLAPFEDPFKRLYSWHLPQRLNLDLMNHAARAFIGTHDFTSFANVADPGAATAAHNPLRTIKRIELVPVTEGVRLEFEAESFLYKMVRNLTGMIVDVGTGKRSVHEIPEILMAKDRKQAGQAAPAKGLFLMRVDYP